MTVQQIWAEDRENQYVYSSGTTYADARDGASVTGIGGSAIGRYGQQYLAGGPTYYCYQALQTFDLSQIPKSAVISAVSYRTWSGDNSNRGNVTLEIYETDYGDAIDVFDYTPAVDITGDRLSYRASSTYPSAGGFVVWVEDSGNLTTAVQAAHAEGRKIQIISVTDEFMSETAPTADEDYVEQTGESYLSIVYTVPTNGITSPWIENESIAESFNVRCSDATYLTAARGTGSINASGVGYNDPAGQLHSGAYFCYQSFGQLDLSSIPKGSEILSVDIEYMPSAIFPISTWYLWFAASDNDGTVENAAFYPSSGGSRNLQTLKDADQWVGEDYVNGATIDAWNALSLTTQGAFGLARIQDAVNSDSQEFHYVAFSQDHYDESAPGVGTNATMYYAHDPSIRIQVTYYPPGGGVMLGAVF